MNGDEYNQDYFERGMELGISGYSNYRWIPELTIPMAMALIDHLQIERNHKVLDFGCAKGYLVKALRLLRRDAWGTDLSLYALSQCPNEVKPYCIHSFQIGQLPSSFDLCIAKDVFEHIDEAFIGFEILKIGTFSKRLFAVIPLGDEGVFRAPINNIDKTHRICKDENWWVRTFISHNWNLREFTFKIDGIKDHYYERFPTAHGFFLLEKKSETKTS